MLNPHPRYVCYPSVVPTGAETTVIIFPRDISRIFREDLQYELGVFGLREDEMTFRYTLEHPCEVRDGCLTFTYFFDREQEYSIRFREKGGKETRLAMYALDSDLYALRPLKGDLHCHTFYSDGNDGIAVTPAEYRREGFDFCVITDHNRYYPSVLAKEFFDDVPLGMHIMLGEELHPFKAKLHIVHLGGTESVCDQYIYHTEAYEAAVTELEAAFSHIPDQYRRRVATAKWCVNQIHKAGGLAVYAHPQWQPHRYCLSKELCDYLYDEIDFDAVEVATGGDPKRTNLQLALWEEKRAGGKQLPCLGVSDSHDHSWTTTIRFGNRFTIVFASDNTTEAILHAIRSGMCVAGELSMAKLDQVHFYGPSLRLILYCHFLFENYFTETWKLCYGEGVLMRRYIEGDDVAGQLAASADTVKTFYQRFFGIEPAPKLSGKAKSFRNKCLQIRLSEPDTIQPY